MANTFLNIDNSLFNKNLMMVDNKQEDELTEILKSFEKPKVPFVLVRPLPGVCVKMRTESGDKGFINICHTSEIPSPQDISEEKLIEVVTNDSEEPSFVIPMSVGQERLEADKGGALCPTYDIAINTEFLNKCQNNKIFMLFTTDVMIEAINTKFNKSFLSKNCLILKNRKVMGTLQEHRIEKRGIRKPQMTKKLIEEIEDSNYKSFKGDSSSSTPKIEVLNSTVVNDNSARHLKRQNNDSDYVILRQSLKGKPELLIGLFKVPTLILDNISMHIGEDRIVLKVKDSNYSVDIFLPHRLEQELALAQMDTNLGILRLTAPLKSSKIS